MVVAPDRWLDFRVLFPDVGECQPNACLARSSIRGEWWATLRGGHGLFACAVDVSAERNSEVQEIPAKLRPFTILLCCNSACSSVGPSGTRKGTAEPWRVFVQMYVSCPSVLERDVVSVAPRARDPRHELDRAPPALARASAPPARRRPPAARRAPRTYASSPAFNAARR